MGSHKRTPGRGRAGRSDGLAQRHACNASEHSQSAQNEQALSVIRKNGREEVQVRLGEFQGHRLVDARIWAEDRHDATRMVPTPKGVSLKIDKLPELIAALQAAEAEARARGWLA